ncbi:hypothetical protein [Deinococcus sp. PEB2-63]
MTGLTVLQRIVNGQQVLLVYREDGRTPTPRQCEEAGEDAGFFDPRTAPAHSSGEYRNARLVEDGFTGELCTHQWGSSGHYGRNPYGMFAPCTLCGVRVATATPQRGTRTTYSYDVWELREPIWHQWRQRGPVPGALHPQAHHEVRRG